jgi:hypothetical protein
MNFQNPSFVRKVIYLAAIAVLLLPIAYLSQPATRGKSAGKESAGGKLAKLRVRYNLSQAELGEIDPASETMKLATLGLRGVAVNALWTSALHYQKVKDFNSLELAVKQIIRLQPNFLKIWDFQAHNLSYNTSVEFDNYRDRYQWVKKGIDFLILGTQYNRDEPGLLNSVGWFVGQKMGRSDENRQFRRLFKEDKDFHTEFFKHGVDVDQALVMGKPDSWLVAKLWYDKAEEAVARGKPLRLKQPLLFYNSAPMAMINGASALEKDDGIFGQVAKVSWQRADAAWSRYGSRELLASAGFMIRLNSVEQMNETLKGLHDELDGIVPGARDKLKQEKLAALKPEERALLDKPVDKLSQEDAMRINFDLAPRISVTADDVAGQAPREKRTRARDMADRIGNLTEVAHTTASYRNIVNYDYWDSRCKAEQLDIALTARRLVRDADLIRNSAGELSKARQMYEEAWENWALLFEKYPVLLDSVQGQELVESIAHYHDLLGKLDVDFPADFKLNKLLDMVSEGRRLKEQIRVVQGSPDPQTPPPGTVPPKSESPAGTKDQKPMPEKPAGETKPASETQPGETKPAAEGSKGDAPAAGKGQPKVQPEGAAAPPAEKAAETKGDEGN